MLATDSNIELEKCEIAESLRDGINMQSGQLKIFHSKIKENKNNGIAVKIEPV